MKIKSPKTKRDPKHEALIKKIKKLYQNYGITTSNMSEDEIERLCEKYREKPLDLDKDLKESEKFSNVFADDIIG